MSQSQSHNFLLYKALDVGITILTLTTPTLFSFSILYRKLQIKIAFQSASERCPVNLFFKMNPRKSLLKNFEKCILRCPVLVKFQALEPASLLKINTSIHFWRIPNKFYLIPSFIEYFQWLPSWLIFNFWNQCYVLKKQLVQKIFLYYNFSTRFIIASTPRNFAERWE